LIADLSFALEAWISNPYSPYIKKIAGLKPATTQLRRKVYFGKIEKNPQN
jgi:hypothetical protein